VFSQDCPEFDLTFDNAFDQWAASSAGEKCTFVQILHHTCQRYTPNKKPEFVNCQAKLMGGKYCLRPQAVLSLLNPHMHTSAICNGEVFCVE
jgi:syntaxin-binding protein 6